MSVVSGPLFVVTKQAAEKRLRLVILSGAKNPSSCSFNELQRSFLRFTQDRLRLLGMTVKGVLLQPANR